MRIKTISYRTRYSSKLLWVLLFAFLPLLSHGEKVDVEFFFQQGCEECFRTNTFVIPRLKEQFPDEYVLHQYDINNIENLMKLLHYQDKFQYKGNASVFLVINGEVFLDGYKRINDSMIGELQNILKTHRRSAPVNLSSVDIVKKRMGELTLPTVVFAGLIDGINPCVFSTLIFFLTLLMVSKISGAKLMLIGLTYCTACFLTYFAIGFGFLRFLKLLDGYKLLHNIIDIFLLAILCLFSFLSFRDAYSFNKNHDSEKVVLQLPSSTKMRIHSILKKGLTYRFLIPGIFSVGILVTAMESVCTGQIYIPILVFLSKDHGPFSNWFAYLFIYNLAFILPLLILFFTVYFGASSSKLLRWSKNNVVVSKILFGVFFILMATFLIFLKV